MQQNRKRINYRITRIKSIGPVRRFRHSSVAPDHVIHVHVRTPNSLKSQKEFKPCSTSINSSARSQTSYMITASALENMNRRRVATLSMTMQSQWADRMDCIQTHHRNRKKKNKCSMRNLLIIILIVVLLLIGLAITLVLLLMKPKTVTQEKVAVLRWNTTGITIAGIPGISGSGSNQLSRPWGIVISYDYSLFVAERGNHRVQKYVRGSTIGVTVAGLTSGLSGSNNASLNDPSAILLDSNENLYIADANNHRIQYWQRGASSGITVAGTGVFGSATNQFFGPYGLTKDWNRDVLYVADMGNARVMSYNAGSNVGTLVFGGNGNGPNSTQLNAPVAIHYDSLSSSFFIANRDNSNVVRWTLGDPNWSLVAGSVVGTGGNTNNLLFSPHGVTVDPMGNVYVADTSNCRIQFFPIGQSIGVTIAGITGFCGNTYVSVGVAFGFTLDNQLNLYVADQTNHRIQKFLRY